MAFTGSSSSVQDTDVAAADVIVALTSDHNVRTIGAVAGALCEGAARSLSSSAVQFVLADAGSTDGTREAARDAVAPAGLMEVAYDSRTGLLDTPYHGQVGRAAALRAILQTTQRMGAKACAVIDAGVHSVAPEWIERLVVP